VIVLDPRFAKVARTVDGDVVVDLIPRAGTEVWS
jgi:hypothetical protein